MTGAGRLLDEQALETIARAYHDVYRQRLVGTESETEVARTDWDDLDPELQEANRASARGVAEHLDRLGLEVRRAPSGTAPTVREIPAHLIEQSARVEHDRWMDDKRASGWQYGPEKDAATKRHPLLIPWAELDEPTRQLDRDRIIEIPSLLALAGLELVDPAG